MNQENPYPEWLRDTSQKLYGFDDLDKEIRYELAVEEAYKKMCYHPDEIKPSKTIEIKKHLEEKDFEKAEEKLERLQ